MIQKCSHHVFVVFLNRKMQRRKTLIIERFNIDPTDYEPSYTRKVILQGCIVKIIAAIFINSRATFLFWHFRHNQ